ncbi:hypothetical protein BDP27DRAFT_1371078 [Rhodocollybia butyracea]|uniref:Uncharacterized protein n=1 Tax=Rhodocollybia butyracea TaxID=206335 RepID=A0A9P5P9N2_9AGAR|nr:hypothetical protein BDP27DRAFT_1371078 [Rhodocollybia butyracea]
MDGPVNIQFADNESLRGYGIWLAQKWKNTQARHQEAQQDINFSMHSQSCSAGQKAVEEALRLRKARDTLCDSIKDLQRVLTSCNSEPYEIAEADLELPELRDRLAGVRKSLSAREHALGVEGKKRYNHLASTLEQKLHNHTKSSVKHRDPTIQSLPQQFNQLQVRMAAVVKGRRAPSNAVVP